MFFIRFTYDGWCQGPEEMTETVLVKSARNYAHACGKIKAKYENAREFVNLTIE